MYLIARLTLAIIEKVRNFGVGLMISKHGGVWERIGEV